MSWRRPLAKLGALFRRRKPVDDLAEEIRAHLALEEQENLESGMPPEEAHYAALRRFGNVTLAQERSREMWGWNWVEALSRDVCYGLRQLRRSPGFSAVAVLTLALGIGANAAIFAVLYNVVLRPLPYPDASRLAHVYLTVDSDRRGARDCSFSYPKFQDLKRLNTVFDSMAAYALRSYTITAPGPAERVRGEIVSASYFSMLGITTVMGRTFLPEEDGDPGAHLVAILSDGLWHERFGADPSVIGKTLQIDGKTCHIVGVTPPGVRGDSGQAMFWIPISMGDSGDLTARQQHWHEVIAHLKPGVTVVQAATEVKAIMRRLEEQQPSFDGIWDANAVRLAESKIDPVLSKGLLVLYGAAGFVLLIACANLANLTMGRMVGRQREIGVRVAIGAGRGAVIRQVLTENLLLSVAGGLAGTFVAAWSMPLLALLRPEANLSFWPSYMRQLDAQAMRVTAPVLVFSLALSFATGILFGLAPALKAARGDVNEVLKGDALQGSQPRRWTVGFRSLLLAAQMALVVVLLVGTGLMLRSFARLTGIPLGITARNVLTVPLDLPWPKYNDVLSRRFFDQLMAQVRGLPGVEAATMGDLPAMERDNVTWLTAIDLRPVHEYIGSHSVEPGFFELFRIPIRSGRAFTVQDRQGPPVAILSEWAARALFPGQNPLGHHVMWGEDHEIVGVVTEVHYEKQKQQLPIVGDMYVPQFGDHLIVRAARNPMSLLPEVRKIVAGLDREIPVQGARTMEDNISLVHSYERFSTLLLALLAALALGLAIVGIYGVFSYVVAARTREFGIRLALGAQRQDVLVIVIREAFKVTLAGLLVGIVAALALTRFLSGFLYGVKPTDPLTLVAVSLLLIGVALVACYIPARRATKVDPMVALRHE
jgi:predicted permease